MRVSSRLENDNIDYVPNVICAGTSRGADDHNCESESTLKCVSLFEARHDRISQASPPHAGMAECCLDRAALAGGSLAVYWFFQSSTAAQDIVLDRDPNDSVTEQGINHNTWRVRAGDFALTIVGRENPTFAGEFRKFEGLSSEQIHLLAMARRIASDRMIRDALGLTKDQKDTLSRIRAGAKVELSEADKTLLTTALKTYLKESDTSDATAKDKSETHFIDAVSDMSRPIAMTAQKSAMERAELRGPSSLPNRWRPIRKCRSELSRPCENQHFSDNLVRGGMRIFQRRAVLASAAIKETHNAVSASFIAAWRRPAHLLDSANAPSRSRLAAFCFHLKTEASLSRRRRRIIRFIKRSVGPEN